MGLEPLNRAPGGGKKRAICAFSRAIFSNWVGDRAKTYKHKMIQRVKFCWKHVFNFLKCHDLG